MEHYFSRKINFLECDKHQQTRIWFFFPKSSILSLQLLNQEKKQSMSNPHVSPFSVYLTIYGLRISIQKLEGGCKVWVGSCFFYNSLNPTSLPFNLPFSSSSPLFLSSSYFHNSISTNFGVKPMADGMENMNYFVLE